MFNYRNFLPTFYRKRRRLRKLGESLEFHSFDRVCPICGHYGKFDVWFGVTLVRDNTCPQCDSHPRQRLFWLWYQKNSQQIIEPIMHFAPEKSISSRFRTIYKKYQTADLFAPADLKVNIEDINLPSESMGTILCNHVLEHVNDRKALYELYRILKPQGKFICSVPIVEGWDETYENPQIQTESERELHFDQRDHVRFYGADFRKRLQDAGFQKIEEQTAYGAEAVRYGLIRGEKFFVCSIDEV